MNKKMGIVTCIVTMVLSMFTNIPTVLASGLVNYEIYPTPQTVTYQEDEFIIRDNVNVVYDSTIDVYTKDRLDETTSLKGLKVVQGTTLETNPQVTNILVGTYGSNEYVDQYVKENYIISENLFNELDSYFLTVDNGNIIILGKDTDAAFYGLTSLYHVFNQIESKTIRNFTIEDYANVASRGFIEGYYGNPWSVEDRAELMRWSGYYKLNSYFYAPKDDPKHNANWRELYTQEELDTLIKPLADAGNASKCRYVYALHPYMSNAIRYNNEEDYQEDLAIMQAKFTQVIESGVRQIAILADDAPYYGGVDGVNYTRTLEDMTAWIIEMQEEYPDLKLELPFCTVEYGGYGEDYYSNFPDNVQIIMTGGKIWGEVSQNYTDSFTNNVGRGPYLWINWPCTDNSKNHLIMGGYSDFLQPNVSPDKIEGIVLNPMQQSEPSKVAIFGNACYSWNIWENEEEADQAWTDSFKYVNQNSPIETEASEAFRELSKHMINQNMDGRVLVLEESEVLKEELHAFEVAMENDTVTVENVDSLIEEFTILADAAKLYRDQGDDKMLEHIIYWISCWDDTTKAAIAYLEAVKAYIIDDSDTMITEYTNGQTSFANSKTHEYWYLNHYQYAEVGVQHIVPFVNEMDTYIGSKVKLIADPSIIIEKFISDSFTNVSTGSEENILDKDDTTSAQYQSPNYVKEGNYAGIEFNNPVDIDNVRVLMGEGRNHIQYSKFQYSKDGTIWIDVSGTEHVRNSGDASAVVETDLGLTDVLKIRLVATKNSDFDSWVEFFAFEVNTVTTIPEIEIVATYSNDLKSHKSTPDVVLDGNKQSEIWLSSSKGDYVPVDATVTLDLGKKVEIESIYVAQGMTKNNDILQSAIMEYSLDGINWNEYASLAAQTEQTLASKEIVKARYVRIRNLSQVNIWWRLGEITVNIKEGETQLPIEYNLIISDLYSVYSGNVSNLYDGDDNTSIHFDPDGKDASNPKDDHALVGDFIGYDLGRMVNLGSVHLVMGVAGSGDKYKTFTIETSTDNTTWTAIEGYENYIGVNSGKDIIDIELTGLEARYIRVKNEKISNNWIQVSEFTVEEYAAQSGTLDNVYTNATTEILSNELEDGGATLTNGSVVLNANEYIGIKFDNNKEISKILLDFTETNTNLVLQVSKNQVIWTEVVTGEQTDIDARFIRLYNTSNDAVTISLSSFEVRTEEVYEKHLESSDIQHNTSWGADTRDNGAVFDGVMGDSSKFAGNPNKDQYIIYDLGQQIDVNALRIYTGDSTQDYIRDAQVQISADMSTWTDLFAIGDGLQDVSGETSPRETFPNADSNYPNYLYAGSDDLVANGRYVRILITANHPGRAIIINEIIINNGEYVGVDNNKDYVGALEEEGFVPTNMSDGDLSTAYKGVMTNASMTYNISEPQGIKSIRIIQSGVKSNATVKATLYSGNTRTDNVETVVLGTLNQSINEFYVPDNFCILDVTILWGDYIPTISEIITMDTKESKVDKTELNTLLSTVVNEKWTDDSKATFNTAKSIAQEISNNTYVSQSVVNSAKATLQKAIDNAVIKGDTASLEAIINSSIKNELAYYTLYSYAAYEKAIVNASGLLENSDNLSAVDITKAIDAVNAAENGLIYVVSFREQAQLALMDTPVITKTDYSIATYNAYIKAEATLKNAIIKDEDAVNQSDRISPKDMSNLTTDYESSITNLASISSIDAAIQEFETYSESLFTDSSYNTYKASIDYLTSLKNEGTITTIKDQLVVVENAKKALVINEASLSVLTKLIEEYDALDVTDYTVDSFASLTTVIEVTKEAVENNSIKTQEDLNTHINSLVNNKKALVSVVSLNDSVTKANNVDTKLYTDKSVKKLKEALASVEELLVSGTNSEVLEATTKIITLTNALSLSGRIELNEYRKDLILLDKNLYTLESYMNYLIIYNSLSTYDDISLKEFEEVKTNLENAISLLKYKNADYSELERVMANIPNDLSLYTSNAVANLNKIIASISYDKNILEQDEVDAYIKQLEAALKFLSENKIDGVNTSDNSLLNFYVSLGFISLIFLIMIRRKKCNIE